VDLAQTFSWIAVGLLALVLAEVMRREVPPALAPALTAAVFASLVFAFGDALWRATPFASAAYWPALLVMWAGVGAVPPTWWLLSVRFADLHGESFAWSRGFWADAPAIGQAFFFAVLLTNPWHGQFLTPAPHRSEFHFFAWAQAALTYATLIATVGVYARLALRARRAEIRTQSRNMALASLLPALANVVYVTWPQPLTVDPTMIAIGLSSMALVYLISRRQLFALSPVEFSEFRRQDPDALLLLDPHGRLLEANPAGRELFRGLLDDPDEALVRVCKALVPRQEEDRHALAQRFLRGLASPGELFELSVAPPRQLRITSVALKDPRGRTSALLLRARDETELADANARAKARAALLEAVFDAAGLAVIVLDRAGRVRFSNGLMSRLWGTRLDGENGAAAREVVHRKPPGDPARTPQSLALIERATRDPEAIFREDFALDDGRVIEVVSIPMREDGATTGRLFLNADVTERRRQESAAREAVRRGDLSRLAGGVAHGFNNLLSAVLGNAELALLTGAPDARTTRHLHEVRDAADRGAVLANQLLAYAGRAQLRRARVDVAELIGREASAISRELSRGAVLQLALAAPLAPVAGDAAQLGLAVNALLRNAAEALPASGGAITIDARDDAAEIVIRVRDDGAGMDAALLARAFEPFFSTKPKAKGLGLAAARGIVSQHGGTLSAESAPGAGATFTLRLPRAREESLAVPAPPPARAARAAWRGAGRILVVDDEQATLGVSRELVEALGFEAVAADRPSAALEAWAIAGGTFRVALIDATMPECDGPELLQRLRLDSPRLPAVIYSGFTRESFALPADPPTEFLQKPFTLDALASALRRVLREDGS